MSRRRQIPSSVRDLRVPNARRRYFEGASELPFRDGTGFDLARAWWLLEASFLAYVDDHTLLLRRFAEVGLRDGVILEDGDLRGVLVQGAGRAFLVFRGTLISRRSNLLTDADLRLVRNRRGPGRLHRGFREAYARLAAPVREACRRLPPGTSLYIAGHSLGGALAVLASSELRGGTALYTFGAPKIGDRDFVEQLPSLPRYRVINEHDLVCQLPPGPIFRHVGQAHLVTGTGDLHRGPAAQLSFRDRFERNLRGRLPRLVERLGDARALRDEVLRENVISDHAPASYSVRIWNATLTK